MLSQEKLQELLAFNGGDQQVVSVYLNADTGQELRETIKLQTRTLLKEAGASSADSERIETYLDHEHDWLQPGLALFSCAPLEFFEALPAAVSFRNRVRVGKRPYVKPLAHLLDHYAHYGVILIDRVGARFFEYHLGELQSTGGTFGEDVRKMKQGGGSSATGMRGGMVSGRQEVAVAHRNLREAAAEAARFMKGKNIRRLFLGGTPETVAQFRDELPKQLQSCVAGTFPMDMDAGEHDVRVRSLALLHQANAEREQKLVETLITTAAKGGNAITGLDETLKAVGDGRVDTLIIAEGLRTPGYSHEETGFITTNLVYSPYGQDELTPMEDVVEMAVARTISQGGHVEVISDSPELEGAGRIGALLRY